MMKSKRFEPIQEIASTSANDLSRAMGEAGRKVADLERQLEQLQSYRDEYLRNSSQSAAPIDAVGAALQAWAVVLNDREYSRQRQAIVAASEELRERELIKMATLTSAIAETLRWRGVKEPIASLTAEAGIAVFRVAFARWVDPANRKELGELMTESLDQLRVAISA